MKNKDYILRARFLRFIGFKIFKLEGGEILPKSLKILSYFLMPIKSYLYVNKKINYDFMTDCYTIDGVVLPAIIIREFKNPNGEKWYRFYYNNSLNMTMIEVKLYEGDK